jgi:putative ABC transport system permease protein
LHWASTPTDRCDSSRSGRHRPTGAAGSARRRTPHGHGASGRSSTDFSFDTIHKTIAPTVYAIIPFAYRYLNIKLTGHDVPEALVGIDRTWQQLGDPRPIERFFLEDHMQELYVDVTRRATVFSAFSAVAVLIACLGLFGLSAYIAERRTREIGIRKATGAGRMDIIKLLTWEFAKPVLVGIALAWVATGILMSRWLATFAYHVALEPWLFAASALIALGIAMATVGVHSYAVSGIRPSDCLRYD